MITVFKHTLSRSRGAIIGWGLTLALLGMMFVPFYDTIAENAGQFQEMLDLYPKEMLAFFTDSGQMDFTTPEGFLAVEYFSFMPLVVGVFAILAGSSMLATDEESGVLDLIAAQPVSRGGLFCGRFTALVLSLLLIMSLGYIGVMVGTTYSSMELDPVTTIAPFASMFALLAFLSSLALLFSMVLPSRGNAAMVAGIVLVAGFFLSGLANLNETLKTIEPFLPLTYYQGEGWTEGFRWDWFGGLLGVALVFTLLAWWAFQRRDLRVGGEGGWKLPRLRRAASKA